jgi:alkanesulfonate monooxygenase SsuD/methylene tetrahydromethanopterin reductase-like flavin-dependent oxidoreductase (luciferase family)
MRVGISLTSNHPDVKDPRQGARWMIERAAAARRAALDSLFIGDQHVSPTPYYQNTPMLGRLLAEWGEAPAGCLFLLPLWHPVLVAEQIGTLAAIAQGRFIMQCGLGWVKTVRRDERQLQNAAFGFRGSARHRSAPAGR